MLAALYIVVVVYALYFNQMLQIRWRRWLTEQCYRDWLTGRAYYLLQLEPSHVENPEQRIQDDIGLVANLSLELATGALNAVVTLGSFLFLLWTLSGTLRLHLRELSLGIPGYNGQIDVEDPAPRVVVSEIPAERGPGDGGDHHAQPEDGHGGPAQIGREAL